MKLFLAVLCVGAAVAIPAHPEYVNGRLVESYQAEQGQFIEGDILLPAGKTVADVRNGLVDTSYRWPGGVVPYTFGIGFSSDEIAAIESAFAEYAAKTCIRFVERTDENDYLRITNQAQGCFSYVGRIGGAQQLNYQSGSCITRFGTLLHEMYHALGFFHEQSRFDRDDYVTIVWDNIDPGRLVESYQAEQGQFIEGDILLPAGKTVADVHNGLVDTRYRWPGGVVPYSFGKGFTSDEKASIKRAFAKYAAKTCIRFVKRTDENDYLRITNEAQGCFSYVGRVGGAQQLNFQSGSCITSFGTLLHEINHALGFFHEQSRFDRDDYVTIVWDNVDPAYVYNFDTYPQSKADGFGEAYDYGSMMHYPANSFSANGKDTIIPKDPNASIGQRVGFSKIDLLKVNKMYCQ